MPSEKSDIIFWAVFKKGKDGFYRCERKVSTDERAPKSRDGSVWSSMKIMDGGSKILCESDGQLEEARTFFKECGMTCYPRRSHEPQNLLETWV